MVVWFWLDWFGCGFKTKSIEDKYNHITNSSRGFSEGARFFAFAKIASRLKAPDEGVIKSLNCAKI